MRLCLALLYLYPSRTANMLQQNQLREHTPNRSREVFGKEGRGVGRLRLKPGTTYPTANTAINGRLDSIHTERSKTQNSRLDIISIALSNSPGAAYQDERGN